MKEVPLTKGCVALVDDADYERVSVLKWRTDRNQNGNLYARTSKWLPGGKVKNTTMHRFILGTAPGVTVDHIDGNGLNNQRSNLRECSITENSCNRKKSLGKKSQYKGVRRDAKYNRWDARIKSMGKSIYLGYFKSEVEAARAYDEAALRLFGEFARLNSPKGANNEP